MVSISLFVLLLATYAYSVPVPMSMPMPMNDNILKQEPQFTSPKTTIMHLVDDGDSNNLPTLDRVTLTTEVNGFQPTTQGSLLNHEHGTRGFQEPLSSSTMETSSPSEFKPRGLEQPLWSSSTIETSSPSEFKPRGLEEPLLSSSTMETSSPSEFQPRGLEQPLWSSSTIETSSPSEFKPRGLEESSTSFLSTVETSTQFNGHKIRGENDQSEMDLQTTEEPSSSVSSFATATGLLRTEREEQEESKSSTMQMNEATTDFSSTGRLNKVIEVIPGRNTETEIISGPNTKTEIVPGRNTKTEIIPGLNTKTEIVPGRNTKTEIIPGPNTKTEIFSGPNSKTEIITSFTKQIIPGKLPLSEGKN